MKVKLNTTTTAVISGMILFLCYAVVQVWWHVSIPFGQSSEGMDHVAYANHLAKSYRLPVIGKDRIPLDIAEVRWQTAFGGTRLFGDSLAESKWEKSFREGNFSQPTDSRFWIAQAAQAPLSYILPAITMAIFGDKLNAIEKWHISRLWSVILGFPAIIAGWYLGRKLWPSNANLGSFILAGWMMLLPAAGALRSVEGNDSLSMTFAAWIVALIIVWKEPTQKRGLVIGTLLAGGLLTKAVFVPLTPVVIFWALRSSRRSLVDRTNLVIWTMIIPVVAMSIYFFVGKASGHWHYLDQSGTWIRLWREAAGEVKPDLATAWRIFLTSNVPSLLRGACLFEYPGKVSFDVTLTAKTVFYALWSAVLIGLIIPGARQRAEKVAIVTIITIFSVFLIGATKEVYMEHGTFFNGKHWMVVTQLPLGIVVIAGLSRLVNAIGLQGKRVHFTIGVILVIVCFLATWNNVFLYQVTYLDGLRAYVSSPDGVVYEMFCSNLPWKSSSFWRIGYLSLIGAVLCASAWAGYLLSPVTCPMPKRLTRCLICAAIALLGLVVSGV